MDINVTDEAASKLRALLVNEGDGAVVRIRETKVGSG